VTWFEREAWVDAAGDRWRAHLDPAGLALWPALRDLPPLWSDLAGWTAPGGPLGDPDDPVDARPVAPRRVALARRGVVEAEARSIAPGRGRSGAPRAHRALHALRARGYPQPRPLGWIAPVRGPGRRASFLVEAPVAAPSAASWLREGPAEAELRALVGAAASLLRRLARDGFVHSCLGAERVRWTGRDLVLGDLEHLRRGPPGIRGLRRHLQALARDPALGEHSVWCKARLVWLASSGQAGRRRWFRRLLVA